MIPWVILGLALLVVGAALAVRTAVSLDEGQSDGRPPATAGVAPWSGIVLPALGRPALIDAAGPAPLSLEVFLAMGGDDEDRTVSARLLSDTADAKVLALTLREAVRLSPRDLEEASLSPWTCEHIAEVLRLRLEFDPAGDLRTTRGLFDLEVRAGTKVFVASSAVFLSPGIQRRANLAVAADIHLATRWDEIERDIERLFPERGRSRTPEHGDPLAWEDLVSAATFRTTFLNPNKVFRDFVREINCLFDRGEIDALLLLGDLVDYKFQRPRRDAGRTYGDTEWSLLEAITLGHYPGAERLRAPLLTSTGNHDYRLYPYSLQVYGLRHCGVSDVMTREYLRRAGALRRPTLRPSDLDAVRIDTGRNHSLDHYFRRFNPSHDYRFEIGGVQHLVLDSGPDAFCRAGEHIWSKRSRAFLGGLWHAIEQPHSNGLTDAQVGVVRRFYGEARTGTTALLFTHAPLLNYAPDSPLSGATGEIDLAGVRVGLSGEATTAQAVAFEQKLALNGLSISTLFRNQLPILEAMAKSAARAAVVSGHVHHDVAFAVDRATGSLMRSGQGSSGSLGGVLDSRVLLLNGMALGHLERSYREGSVPSFRILRLVGGSLEGLDRKTIGRYRVFRNVAVRPGIGGDEVEFSFQLLASEAGADDVLHRIVGFYLDDRDRPLEQVPESLRVEIADASGVRDHQRHRQPRASSDAFLVAGLAPRRLRFLSRPPGVRVALLSETFWKAGDQWESLGLVWHSQMLQ